MAGLPSELCKWPWIDLGDDCCQRWGPLWLGLDVPSCPLALAPRKKPLTLLEALSARVPVIASDVGGVRDIMQPHYEGFVFPAGDVPALQTILELLLHNPHLIPALRAAIRPIKTIADNAREYLTVYQSLGVCVNELTNCNGKVRDGLYIQENMFTILQPINSAT